MVDTFEQDTCPDLSGPYVFVQTFVDDPQGTKVVCVVQIFVDDPDKCQGTTLALSSNERSEGGLRSRAAHAPNTGALAPVLLPEIRRAIRILFCRPRQTRLHRVLINIFPVRQKTFPVPNPLIRESGLPDLALKPEFLLRPVRKISLNQLYRLLHGYRRIERDDQVEMVRHHNKIIQYELLCCDIIPKHINQEICHPVGLQWMPNRMGADEERTAFCLNVLRVRIAFGFRHFSGAKARIL